MASVAMARDMRDNNLIEAYDARIELLIPQTPKPSGRLHNLNLVLLLHRKLASRARAWERRAVRGAWWRLAFHLSSSCSLFLYVLTRSSRTFFRPSALVWRVGITSSTVRSTSTPLMRRKHFRLLSRGARVSRTSLPFAT